MKLNLATLFPAPGRALPQPTRFLISLWPLLLAIILSATLSAPVAAAPGQKGGPPPLVTVTILAEQNVNPETEYVAHVEAIQSVDLQARVSGVLEQIYFKEGSNVSSGDPLYLIEPAPYQMKVAVNRARVDKMQAALNSASQHLSRLRRVQPGALPVTDLETAEAAELQAKADLQEARAVLKLSEIDLTYTKIFAPINGRIGATALSRGNLCGPTSGPLARIVQLDPIRVQFSLSENDIATVKAVQIDAASQQKDSLLRPRLKLASGELLPLSGRIDFVDNRVDPATGSIAVRVQFANPDGLLLPGQYVSLLLGQTRATQQPLIPQAAVLEDRDGRYALVVNELSQVEQRRITTGAVVDSFWAVESGLVAGEQVIVAGLQKVKPGQTVKTTTADAAQGN